MDYIHYSCFFFKLVSQETKTSSVALGALGEHDVAQQNQLYSHANDKTCCYTYAGLDKDKNYNKHCSLGFDLGPFNASSLLQF